MHIFIWIYCPTSSCLSLYSIGVWIGQPNTKESINSVFCSYNLNIWFDPFFLLYLPHTFYMVSSDSVLLLFCLRLHSNIFQLLVFIACKSAFWILSAYQSMQQFCSQVFLIWFSIFVFSSFFMFLLLLLIYLLYLIFSVGKVIYQIYNFLY